MARQRFFSATILILLPVSLSPLWSQAVQPLPDAPAPTAGFSQQPVHTSGTDYYVPSKSYGVVDPGEKVPPLSTRDKMTFWLHEEISPMSWFPVVASAGFEQLANTDPKYGSDSAAFGERVGAATLRVSSYRFFSDSLLPTLTHEDPRYFREGYGSPIARSLHAAEQLVVARRDNGSSGVNYSDIFGHLIGAALTTTYYPSPSVSGRVVMKSWGVSLAGDVGGNLFLEFWPDVRDAVFHRHRREPDQE
jgi:hypothetical protein